MSQPSRKTEILCPQPRSRLRGYPRLVPRSRLALGLITLVASASLMLLAACGDDDSSPDSEPTASNGTPSTATPTTTTPTATPLETIGPTYPPGCSASGLTSDLDLGSGQFATGEPIQITMTLKNCGDNLVRLFYPDGQRYDFFAQNGSGIEVWRWSEGKTFEQVTGELQITVGDSVVYSETWDQLDSRGRQVPAGRYKIFAFSVGCVEPASSDCTFGPVGFVDIGA